MKITSFKKIVALVAIIVTLSALVAPAFATSYICYDTGRGVTARSIVAAAGSGSRDDFVGDGRYLAAVTWYIKNSTTAEMSGTLRALIYSSDGDLIQNSSDYDLAGFAESAAFQAINFTFPETYLMQFGITYKIALVCVDAPNANVHQRRLSTGNYEYSNADYDWHASTLQLDFIVYSEDSAGGTPYVPPDEEGVTTWDVTIANFTAFMVPLIVMLMPAVLLMFLTRRTDKWLLLIGLAIGAGLGYYFGLVPLWIVFLVTIGLIGMAYQSVRGGGGN